MASRSVALGLAPHSGWAALVAIQVVDGAPRVLARDRIEMASDPEARQPYHAVEELDVAEARERLDAYAADAARRAHRGLAPIVEELVKSGHPVAGLGILDSSGRQGGSLAAILASHALIHTADGEHFRNALASAAERCRLSVTRV